jgi:hypothetical protein
VCEEKVPGTEDFTIPAPPPMEGEATDERSLVRAVKEQVSNNKGKLEEDARRGSLDWNLKFILKILLFAFVLVINVWWDKQVSDWVWYSGYVGGHFHLSDTVLVALASTSTANFLALILIVAKHLFPSEKQL